MKTSTSSSSISGQHSQIISSEVHHKSVRSLFKHFMFAFFIAFALCTKFTEAEEIPNTGIHNSLLLALYKLNFMLQNAYQGQGLFIAVLTLLVMLLPRVDQGLPRRAAALSVFFSLMYTGGRAFDYGNSLSVLVSPRINVLKSLILLIGFSFLFKLCIGVLYQILSELVQSKWNPRHSLLAGFCHTVSRIPSHFAKHHPALTALYRRRPFVFLFCVLYLSWFPHILLRYPAAMSYDSWNEAAYFLGMETFTTAQPIPHTWLLGNLLQLGMRLGNANLGLFLFVLLQSAIMTAAIAVTQTDMKMWKISAWLRMFFLLICCTTPYYTGYAAFTIKDYLFTAGFLFWISALLNEILRVMHQEEVLDKKLAVRWILGAILMTGFRNNGVYIYIFSAVVVLLVMLLDSHIRVRLLHSRVLAGLLSVFLIPLIISLSAQGLIRISYHVVQDSPKEMFSLPFQQTARLVRDHGESVSSEDREVISKVLDYDNLPDLYMENTADPVKTTYHAQSTKELTAYLQVWFKEFFQHPVCYLEATWNQCYTLFMPEADNPVFNQDAIYGSDIFEDPTENMASKIGVSIPTPLEGVAEWLCSFYKLQATLPLTGRLNNVAVHIMLLFFLSMFLRTQWKAQKKPARHVALTGFLPFWLIFIFVILGPQVSMQPRYSFPIIYGIPLLMSYCITAVSSNIQENISR